jgi:chromate transporter
MPDFKQALRFWFWLGCVSFGGPAGQIALMQQELVDKRHWIDSRRFLHGLNFAMLLPGPEAQQLATYIGWRLHGVAGGLAAGILFILPGALVLLGLSWLAARHGDLAWVAALFDGVKPVVIAVIAASVWRLGRRTLHGPAPFALALAAFLGLYLAHLPFPAIIAGAALIGYAATKAGKPIFVPASHGMEEGPAPEDVPPPQALPPRRARQVLVFAILLLLPILAIVTMLGPVPWMDIATLFTSAAFVTFGGAYAVLPFIAERAVEQYHWLTPADMLNGLALAESTPGPLILVTQYVGFFAGWNQPGALSPPVAGAMAAALTTYVTFLPCFFFIFVGAPYVEALIHNRIAAGALAAVTAAVVGVILNLGVTLGVQVLLPHGQPDLPALLIAGLALVALLRLNLGVHWLVLAGAGIGLARLVLT